MTEPEFREFLSGDPAEVAPQLLGWSITTEFDRLVTSVTVNEAEAYSETDDEASHTARGQTPRNQPMYGPPGTLYVYLNYGIHFLMNVVVGPPGVGNAVLIRGGVPTEGIPTMIERRGRTMALSDGPGKLTQALGVTLSENNTSLSTGPVRLSAPEDPSPVEFHTTKRIGISKSTELPWRFVGLDI